MRKFDFPAPPVYNGSMALRRRWIAIGAVALVAAIVAVLLVGLGSTKPADAVVAAAAKSENAGGAKLSMSVSVSDPAAQKSASVTASGVFDESNADLNIDLSGLGGSSGLSLPAALGSLEVRYLQENGDPVVYANVPFLGAMLPGGKSWVRVDLEQAGKAAGFDVNQFLNQSSQNPGQILDMLRATGSVREVGSDTVDGVTATHYTATIDLDKAAGLVGQDAKSLVDRLIAAGAPASVPLDVWIGNDDGLVRKLTVDEQLKQATVDLTLEISDYGTPVSVSAPPSDQVLDLNDLISKAGQLAQGFGLGTTH
jgi:hypothetical protein